MKQICLYVLVLCSFFSLKSQEVKQSWGGFSKIKRDFYGKELVYENEETLFVIDKEDKNLDFLVFQISKAPNIYLTTYNASNFKEIQKSVLVFPENKKEKFKYSFLKIGELDGNLLLFVLAVDKREEVIKLLIQKLSKEGVQQGSFYEVDQLRRLRSRSIFSRKDNSTFDLVFSDDKKLCAAVRTSASLDDEKQSVHLTIIDNNLSKQYSGNLTMPVVSEYFNIESYRLTNDQDFLLLGRKWKTREKVGLSGKSKTKIVTAKESRPNYSYTLLSFDTFHNTVKKCAIELPTHYITDISFSMRNCQDSVLFSGFYSPDYRGSITGTFSMAYDRVKNEIIQEYKKDFTKQFLDLFGNKGGVSSMFGDNESDNLRNFRMDDFIVKEDGSSVLVAEKFHVQKNTISSQDIYGYPTSTTNYTFNYKDIMVVYFLPNGKVKWYARIPKQQISYNDGGPFSSYVLNVEDDALYVLFNDHKNNIERLENGKNVKNVGNLKNSNTILVSINNEGVMKRKTLFSAKEQGFVFRPKSSWYPRDVYKSNKLYLFGLDVGYFRRPSFKMGSIDFSK